MTQEQRIMRHLNDYGTITPAEAFNDYGVYRLSAVIFKLRREHPIITAITEGKNRYGERTRYATYVLKKDK